MLSMKCKLKKQKTKFGPSSMIGPCGPSDGICMRLMLYVVQFCKGVRAKVLILGMPHFKGNTWTENIWNFFSFFLILARDIVEQNSKIGHSKGVTWREDVWDFFSFFLMLPGDKFKNRAAVFKQWNAPPIDISLVKMLACCGEFFCSVRLPPNTLENFSQVFAHVYCLGGK